MSAPRTKTGRALLEIIGIVAWFDDETDYAAAILAIEEEASEDAYGSGLLDGEGSIREKFDLLPKARCVPPTTHRYDRLGDSDVLRCRRCGWEKSG